MNKFMMSTLSFFILGAPVLAFSELSAFEKNSCVNRPMNQEITLYASKVVDRKQTRRGKRPIMGRDENNYLKLIFNQQTQRLTISVCERVSTQEQCLSSLTEDLNAQSSQQLIQLSQYIEQKKSDQNWTLGLSAGSATAMALFTGVGAPFAAIAGASAVVSSLNHEMDKNIYQALKLLISKCDAKAEYDSSLSKRDLIEMIIGEPKKSYRENDVSVSDSQRGQKERSDDSRPHGTSNNFSNVTKM